MHLVMYIGSGSDHLYLDYISDKEIYSCCERMGHLMNCGQTRAYLGRKCNRSHNPHGNSKCLFRISSRVTNLCDIL